MTRTASIFFAAVLMTAAHTFAQGSKPAPQPAPQQQQVVQQPILFHYVNGVVLWLPSVELVQADINGGHDLLFHQTSACLQSHWNAMSTGYNFDNIGYWNVHVVMTGGPGVAGLKFAEVLLAEIKPDGGVYAIAKIPITIETKVGEECPRVVAKMFERVGAKPKTTKPGSAPVSGGGGSNGWGAPTPPKQKQ